MSADQEDHYKPPSQLLRIIVPAYRTSNRSRKWKMLAIVLLSKNRAGLSMVKLYAAAHCYPTIYHTRAHGRIKGAFGPNKMATINSTRQLTSIATMFLLSNP